LIRSASEGDEEGILLEFGKQGFRKGFWCCLLTWSLLITLTS
jgi:hypothetical protein